MGDKWSERLAAHEMATLVLASAYLMVMDSNEAVDTDKNKLLEIQTLIDYLVTLTGNETIGGNKTFSNPVTVDDATGAGHALNKGQGDTLYATKTQKKSCSIPFLTPVVGDGACPIDFPEEMNGWDLTDVHAHAGTAPSGGPVTIQVRNSTDGVDALSSPITIEDGENDSNDATTQPVIDTANDDVATDDIWWIDFDTVNGAEDVVVRLTFTGAMD